MALNNRCNSPGTSNMIDLISSVNTLIDKLSGPAANDAASALTDKSAADINRQLEQLEKLFTRQKSHRRSASQRKRRRQQSVAVAEGACSRSPCSNCTASNCNVESSSRRLTRRSGGQRHRRYHSASLSSSLDTSTYSRCCILNSSCLPTKHEEEGVGGAEVGQLIATEKALENTSNRNKHRTVVRRRPKPPKMENIDFGYLKEGLQAGQESRESGCGDRVVQMEQMIGKLNSQVDRLKNKCNRQLRMDTNGCGLSNRLKGEIRQVQTRVSYLYSLIQQTLGSARSSKAVGCRHAGSASEQARDPLTDLKCKYERSLLYSRFDVNWPFLHIIAPRPISWETVCCDEID